MRRQIYISLQLDFRTPDGCTTKRRPHLIITCLWDRMSTSTAHSHDYAVGTGCCGNYFCFCKLTLHIMKSCNGFFLNALFYLTLGSILMSGNLCRTINTNMKNCTDKVVDTRAVSIAATQQDLKSELLFRF